ncbi:PqiB family protein [Xylophilus ampelinus]|uniref:Paraquat-inducible protein B n=1 Tax=Xylophilus ampelinus TaxID=54067 RepID=A0A318SK32_9BURK|nr:MlaD family protein [Xylophilus ampelinus]MCS4511425.1 MlaD family protein [Xylophilus ampelinus]PYE75832.1 paraquat-inducible protein B [Xylophilus ampelinus]
MTDHGTPPSPPDIAADAATPRITRRRNWLPSLIWLIPVVAALVGVALVARALVNRGPEIEVSFKTAEGLEAGKTAVRYKNVQIGVVQSLRLDRDRSKVRVVLQLSEDARGFTTEDTRFWVVRPRLDTSGISGLGTLLSGAYISADPGTAENTVSSFVGLEVPPIVTRDASGKQFVLSAADIGSLDIGAPIYFRHIRVGQVASYELNPDGRGVTIRIFVNAPYDTFVGTNTRFWHASGIDMQLSSSGVTLRTQSFASILLGGIAFGAPEEGGGPVAAENTTFGLAGDETTAMKKPDGPAQTLLLYFNQSLRGLQPGAAVDFRGVDIGEVKSIGAEFSRTERDFRMPVLVQVYPDRLRQRSGGTAPESRRTHEERLRILVDKGLRAQLRNGNLLTGQLYVAFDFFPKSPAAKIDLAKVPLELPTVANSLDELQSQVQEIVGKVNKVPIEEIGRDVRATLAKLDKALVGAETLTRTLNNDVSPEITAALKDARKTIDSANQMLASDAPLQADLRQTLQDLSRTATSVRVLTDYLERHPESLLRGKPEDKK